MRQFVACVLMAQVLLLVGCDDRAQEPDVPPPYWEASGPDDAWGHPAPAEREQSQPSEGMSFEEYQRRQRELGPMPRWQDQFKEPEPIWPDRYPPDLRRDNPLYDPPYWRHPGDRPPGDRPYGGEPRYPGR